jgi:LysM repeat protein
MIRLLKIIPLLSFLLWFGCAQVEKEVKAIQEGFVQGVDETKKAISPADSKPKQSAKTAEVRAKPPEPVKPKELPPPPPEPMVPKDLPTVPPPAKAEEFILHKVVAGETLATIAKWYNGKPTAWKEIAAHNPGVQPSNLKAGQRIKVPKSLATAHQEQPDFSTATGPPAGKKPPKESKETEAPAESKPTPSGTVFGPK